MVNTKITIKIEQDNEELTTISKESSSLGHLDHVLDLFKTALVAQGFSIKEDQHVVVASDGGVEGFKIYSSSGHIY